MVEQLTGEVYKTEILCIDAITLSVFTIYI